MLNARSHRLCPWRDWPERNKQNLATLSGTGRGLKVMAKTLRILLAPKTFPQRFHTNPGEKSVRGGKVRRLHLCLVPGKETIHAFVNLSKLVERDEDCLLPSKRNTVCVLE